MESYQRVWAAESGVDPQWGISVTGQFDEQGIRLRINNTTDTTLQSPRLQWAVSEMSLGSALAVGESEVRAQRREAGGMLVSGEDNLRQSVLDALRSSATWLSGGREVPPLLVGFVEGDAVPSLIKPAEQVDLESRSAVVVRVPLRIEPTPPGQRVRIPAPLMRPVLSRTTGIPYDTIRHEWLPSTSEGEWLIGFRPPEGIGTLRPVQVVLDVNINAPRHHVTLRRQQVRNAAAALNPAGEVIAKWIQPVGPQDLTVQLDAQDADADGTIWLMIEVKRDAPPAPGELPSMWELQWLRANYEADVIDG